MTWGFKGFKDLALELPAGQLTTVAPPDRARIRYNSSLGVLEFSIAGAAYVPIAAGGASPWTATGTVVRLVTVSDTVAIGAAAMVGGEKMRLVGALRVEAEVTLQERVGDPGAVVNTGHVYTKDVGTVSELFYQDSAGSVTQITSAGGNVNPTIPVTAGENLAAGAPVSMADSAGPRAFEADANGAGNRPKVIGFATTAIVSAASGEVQTTGEIPVPDANWDVVPTTANVGDTVWLSENVGNVTLSAPGTPGSTRIRLGNVTIGGAGAVAIAIKVGDPIIVS